MKVTINGQEFSVAALLSCIAQDIESGGVVSGHSALRQTCKVQAEEIVALRELNERHIEEIETYARKYGELLRTYDGAKRALDQIQKRVGVSCEVARKADWWDEYMANLTASKEALYSGDPTRAYDLTGQWAARLSEILK